MLKRSITQHVGCRRLLCASPHSFKGWSGISSPESQPRASSSAFVRDCFRPGFRFARPMARPLATAAMGVRFKVLSLVATLRTAASIDLMWISSVPMLLLLRRKRERKRRRRVGVRVRLLLLRLLLLLLLTTTSMMMMMTCPRAAGVSVKLSLWRGPLNMALNLALNLARMRRAMAAAAGRRTERLHARIRRAMAAAMA